MSKVKARLSNGVLIEAPILDMDVYFGGVRGQKAHFRLDNEEFLKEVQKINKKMRML